MHSCTTTTSYRFRKENAYNAIVKLGTNDSKICHKANVISIFKLEKMEVEDWQSFKIWPSKFDKFCQNVEIVKYHIIAIGTLQENWGHWEDKQEMFWGKSFLLCVNCFSFGNFEKESCFCVTIVQESFSNHFCMFFPSKWWSLPWSPVVVSLCAKSLKPCDVWYLSFLSTLHCILLVSFSYLVLC